MRPVNPANAGEELWTNTLRRMEQLERGGRAAIIVETVAPGPTDGSDGDFWIDRVAGRLYGPKGQLVLGQWPPTYLSMEPNTAWTALPLLNGWVNFGGAYAPASYRFAGGRVLLRGMISRATPAALGTALATLPIAPPYEEAFCQTAGSSAFNPVAFARVHATAGAQLILGDGNTTNAATSLSLAGISYSVS